LRSLRRSSRNLQLRRVCKIALRGAQTEHSFRAILRTRSTSSDRLFPEATLDFALIAAPVSRQQTVLHIAVEATVRPIADPSDIAVLHRIEVDVIDMTLEVRIVADCVLPKPSLPDARFAPPYLASRPQLRRRQHAGESALDLTPTSREIGIAGRQGPNGMEMV